MSKLLYIKLQHECLCHSCNPLSQAFKTFRNYSCVAGIMSTGHGAFVLLHHCEVSSLLVAYNFWMRETQKALVYNNDNKNNINIQYGLSKPWGNLHKNRISRQGVYFLYKQSTFSAPPQSLVPLCGDESTIMPIESVSKPVS